MYFLFLLLIRTTHFLLMDRKDCLQNQERTESDITEDIEKENNEISAESDQSDITENNKKPSHFINL